jgi:hypothetical protein
MARSTTSPPTGEQAPTAPRAWRVDVPLVGPVGWPPTGSLAFLGVMAAFAAFEIVSWPVAAALAVGHVMARDHDHPVVREVGEGLESA